MENDLKISQLPQVNTISGEELYVVASSGHNYSVTGNTIKEFVAENLQNKEPGKGLSSNDYTSEEKAKLRELPTNSQLEENFGKKQDVLKSSEDVKVSEDAKLSLTDKAKLELFVSQWNASTLGNGGFNWDTLLGSLNGIDDLTIEDMQLIMAHGSYADFVNEQLCRNASTKNNAPRIRTTLPTLSSEILNNYIEFSAMNWWQPKIEVVQFCRYNETLKQYGKMKLSASFLMLYGADKLREIKDWLIPQKTNTTIGTTEGTGLCRIEEIRIYELKYNIKLANIDKISLTSLQFLVEKAANTTPITVSVHKDVYAKLTDESNAEWHKVLTDASEKNISFATNS